MFKFMGPTLRDGSITPTIDILMKGILRTLLVLLHDFPDYLTTNHFTLCNLIPSGCVQLRNLVLSAFPRHKRLPDPFMQGLKIENIIENSESPRLCINPPAVLENAKIRAPLDRYLQSHTPEDFPRRLVERIKIVPAENGMHNGVSAHDKRPSYNVDLLGTIVLYIAIQAIEASQKHEETGVLIFDGKSPHMELLTAMNAELDIEGLSF
jgi:CCR4-NOT transcription complex subunit 1